MSAFADQLETIAADLGIELEDLCRAASEVADVMVNALTKHEPYATKSIDQWQQASYDFDADTLLEELRGYDE